MEQVLENQGVAGTPFGLWLTDFRSTRTAIPSEPEFVCWFSSFAFENEEMLIQPKAPVPEALSDLLAIHDALITFHDATGQVVNSFEFTDSAVSLTEPDIKVKTIAGGAFICAMLMQHWLNTINALDTPWPPPARMWEGYSEHTLESHYHLLASISVGNVWSSLPEWEPPRLADSPKPACIELSREDISSRFRFLLSFSEALLGVGGYVGRDAADPHIGFCRQDETDGLKTLRLPSSDTHPAWLNDYIDVLLRRGISLQWC
jgi:hypothetical protein